MRAGLEIDPARAGRIHAARLGRLIDEGAIMTVQHIADLEPARRTAILVAQAATWRPGSPTRRSPCSRNTWARLFSKARNRDERRFQATRRDVAKALLLFRRTIAALRHAKETGEDGVAVVDREIGMEQLDGVLPVIGAVADVADQDILVTAAERYSVLRRFSPRFLAAFDFQVEHAATIPCWPPSNFSGRWTATAPARCPSGRRRRSCRRNGAS